MHHMCAFKRPLTSYSATTRTPGISSARPPANWARPLAEASRWAPSINPPGPWHTRGHTTSSSSSSCHTGPSRANQRRLSLTQRRAVNQPAPRRELGGGPLPGPQTKTYLHLQAVSAPLLFWKNDRVALIRVMTKDKDWKGVWEGGEGGGSDSKEVGELDNIHTLLTSLHLCWCPRKIPLRRKIRVLLRLIMQLLPIDCRCFSMRKSAVQFQPLENSLTALHTFLSGRLKKPRLSAHFLSFKYQQK